METNFPRAATKAGPFTSATETYPGEGASFAVALAVRDNLAADECVTLVGEDDP
jgi:hypothetical protein